MMIAGLVFIAFCVLVLITAVVVSNGQRKNRRHLRSLKGEVQRLNHQLRTPEERAAEARRIEAIEAEKRRIHGRFDSGGC